MTRILRLSPWWLLLVPIIYAAVTIGPAQLIHEIGEATMAVLAPMVSPQ